MMLISRRSHPSDINIIPQQPIGGSANPLIQVYLLARWKAVQSIAAKRDCV
jgi:hypothetical protein